MIVATFVDPTSLASQFATDDNASGLTGNNEAQHFSERAMTWATYPGTLHVRRWDAGLPEAIRTGSVTDLWLDGWDQPNLEKLIPIAGQIRRLYLRFAIGDLSGLGAFTRLRYLSISDPLDTVPFEAFPELETLTVDVPTTLRPLEAVRALKHLYITHGIRSVAEIPDAAELNTLMMAEAPLESLAGLERFPRLRQLILQQVPLARIRGIGGARCLEDVRFTLTPKLESVAELGQLKALKSLEVPLNQTVSDVSGLGQATALQKLRIIAGPLVGDVQWLGRLVNLVWLGLDTRGEIDSLDFLRTLQKLEKLWLSRHVKIASRDLSPIASLPALQKLNYGEVRGYHPAKDELMEPVRRRAAASGVTKRSGPDGAKK